ncbi:hypothetical protein PpBr36_02000 [Pyricularia pennisetigena]|uniref:hypothetical protein n=1 Tax=Pyricularia pennisetigena TaxID=1578925 RepID=UPI00114D74D2|nr:hypothetical protein PpBr36_02000 [Pyricularia pennisetigena]TLS27946.1 hypothetical protein PpBr36_02000 [Pyricularia pennisetigena]
MKISNIPPHSAPRSRISYAVRTLAQTAFAYFLPDAMSALPPADPVFYSLPKQTLGFDVMSLSRQDLAYRLASTMSFYATIYCAVMLQTNSLSLLVVLAGLDSPASHYWRQTWRKWVTGHADAISDEVLGIPRRTLVSVYTRLWLAFFLSGVCHISSDVGMGIPISKAVSFTTFILQPVGIVL